MKRDFTDRASFLKAMIILREATFFGYDLLYDDPSRTMTLTLTRADSAGGAGAYLRGRKPSYIKTVLSVRRIVSYKRYLALEEDDVYVFDRGEVGRGGQELSFFFRPGDRSVMDVERIDGAVEDAGKATAVPHKPVIRNPLLTQELEAGKKSSLAGRRLDKSGRKRS